MGKLNSRYFEVEEPYYALIKAGDEEELMEIYFESIKKLTNEEWIPGKYKEIDKEHAVATIAIAIQMWESIHTWIQSNYWIRYLHFLKVMKKFC